MKTAIKRSPIGMLSFGFVALAFGLLAGCGSRSDGSPEATEEQPAPVQQQAPPEPAYQLPDPRVSSLLGAFEAVRERDGSISFRGTSLLPPGTKIGVQRVGASGQNLGEAKAVVQQGGDFVAGGFSDRGEPIKAGRGTVEVMAYFNGFWQSPEVLAIVGSGGVNLPQSMLTLEDPEFPAEGGHWVEKLEIEYPEIAPETIAIQRVKAAKVNVQGRGRSPTPVSEVVAWYAGAPGFVVRGWSAERAESKWIVTLACTDGGSQRTAQWEYDPASQSVRYLDPLAKILSWLPED